MSCAQGERTDKIHREPKERTRRKHTHTEHRQSKRDPLCSLCVFSFLCVVSLCFLCVFFVCCSCVFCLSALSVFSSCFLYVLGALCLCVFSPCALCVLSVCPVCVLFVFFLCSRGSLSLCVFSMCFVLSVCSLCVLSVCSLRALSLFSLRVFSPCSPCGKWLRLRLWWLWFAFVGDGCCWTHFPPMFLRVVLTRGLRNMGGKWSWSRFLGLSGAF